MNAEAIIRQLTEAGKHPARTVAASMAGTGRKAVGCFPVFTPDELVHAAGLLPVGMWGGNTGFKLADRYLQSFACSIMRANLELGIGGVYKRLSGVLVPTLCDTLKCTCENWKVAVPDIPLIGVTYPQNRTLPAARTQLLAEFESIRAQLAALAGIPEISDAAIEESLAVYDAYRAAMRRFTALAARYPGVVDAKARHYIIKAAYFMEKRIYTEQITQLCDALEQLPEEPFDGLRVVITGVMVDSEPLLDILVEHGVAVVDDLLLQESVQFGTDSGTTGTALERMAQRMLQIKGCSVFYEPGKSRGRILVDLVRRHNAEAVLVFLLKFCDPEEFDYPIYKKELDEAGIRSMQIETDQQADAGEQLRTRLQSFVEMVM